MGVADLADEESIDSLHKHLVEQRGPKHDNIFLLAELGISGHPLYRMDHLVRNAEA